MIRSISRMFGIGLVGLIAACAFVEIAFQVIERTPLWRVLPVSEIAMYGPDPFTGYRHRAGARGIWLQEHRSFVVISHLGLRDRERQREHGVGPRAVVVGDSIVEAVQVDLESTAVRVAERALSAKRAGAEVINLGLAGATPAIDVARLQSMTSEFHPDTAVVLVSIGDFLNNSSRDDSAWPGYRSDASGELQLSYAFRNSRGYKFRTSAAGALAYSLFDHSALARILNSRKNIGWLAEWPSAVQAAETTAALETCRKSLATQNELWSNGQPADARAVLDAFIRDVAKVSQDNRMPVTVVLRGIPAPCVEAADLRQRLVAAISTRLGQAGLRFFDMDAVLNAREGGDYLRRLHGFGASRGQGHLNGHGNQVYGEILAEIIGQNFDRK